MSRVAFLLVLAAVIVGCAKPAPAPELPKKSSDLGTRGGATQVGMEPH